MTYSSTFNRLFMQTGGTNAVKLPNAVILENCKNVFCKDEFGNAILDMIKVANVFQNINLFLKIS